MTMKMTVLLATLAIFWLGCGVDEEPMRPRVTKQADSGPDLAKMSPEEREAATAYQDELGRKYFSWADENGPERDAVADTRTCREQLLSNGRYVRANGMTQFTMVSECMEKLGWAVNKAAVQGHVTGDSAS